jgi:hypothetical protein
MGKTKTKVLYIRGLEKTTKAALEELAASQNISTNKFVVNVLELVAKDKLTLNVLEDLHIVLQQNTSLMLKIERFLLELGVGVIE